MSKVHTVILSAGDSLDVKFQGMSEIDLVMPYDQVLEAALQYKLQELNKRRYGQNTQYAAQQFNPGAELSRKW